MSVKKQLIKLYKLLYVLIWGEQKFIEKDKQRKRREALRLPITAQYPFDPEAKFIMKTGINGVVFDIGANTGIYSELFEQLTGPENLYIFEPLPYLCDYLKRRFKRSHVFNMALSDKQGTGKIRIPYIKGKKFDTRASFNAHEEPNQTGFEEIEVKYLPLDVMVDEISPAEIGLIKIDVEGHELEVVNGATRTLNRYRPMVLIEIESRHHSYPIEKIFAKFLDLGYRGFYLDGEKLKYFDISRFDSAQDQKLEYLKSRQFIKYLNNFIFIHNTDEQRFRNDMQRFLNDERQID